MIHSHTLLQLLVILFLMSILLNCLCNMLTWDWRYFWLKKLYCIWLLIFPDWQDWTALISSPSWIVTFPVEVGCDVNPLASKHCRDDPLVCHPRHPGPESCNKYYFLNLPNCIFVINIHLKDPETTITWSRPWFQEPWQCS